MGAALLGAALLMFAVGAAGLIIWHIDSGLVSTAANTQAASQLRFDADLALELGVVALIVGFILTVLALRDP